MLSGFDHQNHTSPNYVLQRMIPWDSDVWMLASLEDDFFRVSSSASDTSEYDLHTSIWMFRVRTNTWI